MRKVLVLMGDGINSENELVSAFAQAGGEVHRKHVNELLRRPDLLKAYQLLALPGGFSFGDELRSGKILAEKLRDALATELSEFLNRDGRVLGICNGFQVLAQLGAFDLGGQRSFTLAENDHERFMNKWARLSIAPEASGRSAWFQGLSGSLFLPVRHREGRVVKESSRALPFAPLRYDEDINGSFDRTAGVLSADGRIFGLMPHPEVATQTFLHPINVAAEENVGKIRTLFRNGLA